MPPEQTHSYRVRALSAALADEVRITRRSPDYDHPVHAEIADGSAPCRVCLEKFRPGEDRRLLLTYDPFREVAAELPLPGPIFIHERQCSPWLGDDLPASVVNDRLTLIAYGDSRMVVDEVRTSNSNDLFEALDLFALQPIDYVHVRSTPAGCFLFQLDPNAT
jgi:hypothetical protein